MNENENDTAALAERMGFQVIEDEEPAGDDSPGVIACPAPVEDDANAAFLNNLAHARRHRNEQICADALTGALTQAQIGHRYGIGGAQVANILRKAGVKSVRQPKRFTERNAEIVRLRESGMSYGKIGLQYGLSGTRIRAICLAAKKEEGANG